MSRKEVNTEIQNILSQLSDKKLQVVLDHLKDIENINHSELVLSKNLGKILEEDYDLLKRLTQ